MTDNSGKHEPFPVGTLHPSGYVGVYYCASCLGQFNEVGERLVAVGESPKKFYNTITKMYVDAILEKQT